MPTRIAPNPGSINQGTISKLLLEEIGLNIGSVVLARLFGDEQVKLNCMAADFSVTDGLMRTRSFIVDTEEALLKVNGTINLAQEQLDLTLKQDTRGLRVFSLRAPLYLRGSFKQPEVSVDKGVLALRAGGTLVRRRGADCRPATFDRHRTRPGQRMRQIAQAGARRAACACHGQTRPKRYQGGALNPDACA